MTRTWNELEAVSLADRYWLKVCLSSSDDDAWYLTRYDTGRDAVVRVRRRDTPAADAQLDLWRYAMGLDHPHIVRMLDAGRAEAEGMDVIYAVCEYPDDFLASAVAERPLTPAEAREVLDAALSALGFLHERGLVHGAVDTGHIMAFGDTIKLPSDTIRPAGGEVSTASDMESLGVLLHEMLTREPPRADAKTDFQYLPEPFRSIVRHTVRVGEGERWTVEDIRTHLSPPVAEVVAEAPGVEAARAPVVVLQPPHVRPEAPVDRGFPLKWIPVAGLAAATVLGAFVLGRPDAPKVVELERPLASAPARLALQTPARTAPPVASPEAQSRDRVGRPDARPSTGAAIWRVIAYTYNGRTNAERKARSLNEKRAGWHAEVFAPRGNRAPYFVSLGGRMTLAEAERVQKEARQKGLPRDTFVRNFAN